MENTFADLGVLPFFAARLGERNIFKPTDIQARVIPELLEGRSVCFRSATGTGKTFAYLIPLFQRLFSGSPEPGSPAALILSPTYELCSQIKNEAEFLLKDFAAGSVQPEQGRPKLSLLIGSANMNRQIDGLKKEKPQVVVGNPGRILLLAKMGKLKLGALRALVFDEGDRLVAEDLRGETLELLDLIGRAVKGGLLCAACSATLGAKSRELLLPFMGERTAVIETDEQEILRERIQHWAIWSEDRRKVQTLRSFLAAEKPKKALIFFGRSWDAGNIVSQLQHHGFSVAGLYGDMDKNRRRDAVEGFRSGKIAILVSSDLAARGLDIPGITHVIALDVPQDGEGYTHRAGRTGRAGKRGIMVSIGDEDEMHRLALLEKRLGLTVYPKELYGGRVTTPPTITAS
jgi:superfamily II DNA/RNA helicase